MYHYKLSHTNCLHTARFLVSQSVGWFGFNTDALDANYVSIGEINEICKWLYKPTVVLEIANHQTVEEIDFLVEQCHAQNIEINFSHPNFREITHKYLHAIVKLNSDELNNIDVINANSAMVICIHNTSDADILLSKTTVLLNKTIFLYATQIDWLEGILSHYKPYGICIPNIKSVDGNIDYDWYEKFLTLPI